MQTMTYSGKSPMRAKAVAEPNSGLHMEVNIWAPMASKMPSMPYAARKARKGEARSSHLTIWRWLAISDVWKRKVELTVREESLTWSR